MKTTVKVGDFVATTTGIREFISSAKLVTAVKGKRVYWTIPENTETNMEERHGYSHINSVVAVYPSYPAALAAYDAQQVLLQESYRVKAEANRVYLTSLHDAILEAGGVLCQDVFAP